MLLAPIKVLSNFKVEIGIWSFGKSTILELQIGEPSELMRPFTKSIAREERFRRELQRGAGKGGENEWVWK